MSTNNGIQSIEGLAKTVYIYTVYDHMFGEFSAKNAVFTPYIYGSGQP
jgi:hypothetical protein